MSGRGEEDHARPGVGDNKDVGKIKMMTRMGWTQFRVLGAVSVQDESQPCAVEPG